MVAYLLLMLLLAGPALAGDLSPYRMAADCEYPRPSPGHVLAAPGMAVDAAGNGALYLPLFQAGHAAAWPGNLKKLQLREGTAVDAQGLVALESQGERIGRLRPDAATLWTRAELPFGARPDGADMRLGGAGQALMLDQPQAGAEGGERRIYLEPVEQRNGEPSEVIRLAATDEMAVALRDELAVQNQEQARTALRWLMGMPTVEEGADEPDWRLGAILHSQPAVVDYGPAPAGGEGARIRRILFGTQWGLLHMLADEPSAPGQEIFAYLPRSQLSRLPALAGVRDTREVDFEYGVDGSPVVLRRDNNGDGRIDPADGDWVRVVFGLRRGGSGYQMLDISDPDGPPRLLWRLVAEGEYSHLAQGFSTPVAAKVEYEDGLREVLIMGAGYHGGRDAQGAAIGKDAGSGPDAKGNAVLVVDAASGELIWQAVGGTAAPSARQASHPAMRHSIASPVAVLRNPRGLVYRIYVGDSGGNVWRVDLPPGRDPEQRARHWGVNLLARLGGAGDNTVPRRFFHPPSVFRARDDRGVVFDGVVLASGNQADPLASGEQDYLFYLRDYSEGDASAVMSPLDPGDLPDLGACAVPGPDCPPGSWAGWKMLLEGEGEKGLSSPHVAGGQVWFTSYLPPVNPTACEPALGRNRLYRLQLENGAPAGLVRLLALAPGLPASIQQLGGWAWIPAGPLPTDALPGDQSGPGVDPADSFRQLLPVISDRPRLLYWRDLDRD